MDKQPYSEPTLRVLATRLEMDFLVSGNDGTTGSIEPIGEDNWGNY